MGTNKYLLNGKNGRLEIKNNYGKFEILFDLQDYEIIKNYTWRILPNKKFNTYYAISGSHKKQILMHRLITNCPANKVIDHKNHNGLDNQKANLKICTRLENMQNQRFRITNSSGYSNIVFEKDRNKWRVIIRFNKKYYRKRFTNIEDAILHRNKMYAFLGKGDDALSEPIITQ